MTPTAYLTPAQACTRFGVSPNTLANLRERGVVRAAESQ